MIPEERLINKIYLIRGQKVMLDSDLADLYGVETKRLKEQVRRNKDRFPDDFMFEMTREEFENWRTQFATSKSVIMGSRYAQFCLIFEYLKQFEGAQQQQTLQEQRKRIGFKPGNGEF